MRGPSPRSLEHCRHVRALQHPDAPVRVVPLLAQSLGLGAPALVLGVLAAMAYGASQMSRPFAVGEELPISLDPIYLPYYLLRTILRMFTALAFSLLFSFVFAAIAAKFRTAEKP